MIPEFPVWAMSRVLLTITTLVEIYRRFLRTQQAVVREWLRKATTQQLLQRVYSQINPSLQEALKQYDLIHYEDGRS